jgi:antitoxin CcdA
MGKIELKIDAELLAQAAAAGVKADQVAEAAIRAAVSRADPIAAKAGATRWAEENAEAIADYNRRIHERGLIGSEFRKW